MTNPMYPPPYSLAQCIERMPLHARTRFEDLKALATDATAMVNILQERYVATQDEFARLQSRYGRAVTIGSADEAKKLQRELEAITAKADKLERERSRRNSVAANTQQVVSRLQSFIEAWQMQVQSSITAPPQITVAPQLQDGETAIGAIARLRSAITHARAEIAMVKTAPLPAAEVKAALVACIDKMAMEGRPRISVEGTRAVVHWPDELEFSAPGQGALAAPSGGASKLLCWLHRDEIIDRFTADIPGSIPGSIPAGERPGRIRALEERLFVYEVEEEFFVAEAIAAGLDCHRRADASPWAVLGFGLAIEEAQVAEAAE